MAKVPVFTDQVSRGRTPSGGGAPTAQPLDTGARRLGQLGAALQSSGTQAGLAIQSEADKNSVRDAVTLAREKMLAFSNEQKLKVGREAENTFAESKKFNDDLKKEIGATLGNGRQQRMFGPVFETYALTTNDQAHKHQLTQMKVWKAESLAANSNASLNTAIDNRYDNDVVFENFGHIVTNTAQQWKGHGNAQQKVEEAASNFHLRIVGSMLQDVTPDNFEPLAKAEGYLTKWGEQIDPTLRQQLRNNIHKATVSVQSQKVAQFISNADLTPSGMLEALKKGKSINGIELTKEVKDLAEPQLRSMIAKQLQFKKLRNDEQIQQVANFLAPQVESMTPSDVELAFSKTGLEPAEVARAKAPYGRLIAARDQGRLNTVQKVNYIRWFAASRTPALRRDADGWKIDPRTNEPFPTITNEDGVKYQILPPADGSKITLDKIDDYRPVPLDEKDFKDQNFLNLVGLMNQSDVEKVIGLQDNVKKGFTDWENQTREEAYKRARSFIPITGEGEDRAIAISKQAAMLEFTDQYLDEKLKAVPEKERTSERMWQIVGEAYDLMKVELRDSVRDVHVPRVAARPTQAAVGEFENKPVLTSSALDQRQLRTGIPTDAPVRPATPNNPFPIASVGEEDAMRAILKKQGRGDKLVTPSGKPLLRIHVDAVTGKIKAMIPKGTKLEQWEAPDPGPATLFTDDFGPDENLRYRVGGQF